MSEQGDLLEQLRQTRVELTRLQGRVTDMINLATQMTVPPQRIHQCLICHVRLRGARSLAEHVYNSHNGPVPAHYQAAEQAAGLEDA